MGAPDLIVLMPVLACSGASIENNVVCIRLYWCLYWSVFGLVLVCIGLYLNVLASALARIFLFIEKVDMYLVCIGTYHYFIHTKYQQNTCQYMLVCIGIMTMAYIAIHINRFPPYLESIVACTVVCIQSVFASIIIQYVCNTNTIHAHTDWHVLNTYLVLNTYWYVFNTYHQYIPQYMLICRMQIGMY